MKTVREFLEENKVGTYEIYDEELGSAVWRPEDTSLYSKCFVVNVYPHNGVPVLQVKSMNDDGTPGMSKPKWSGYCSGLALDALDVYISERNCNIFKKFRKMVEKYPIGKVSLICRIVGDKSCEILDTKGNSYGGGPLSPPYDTDMDRAITELLIGVLDDARSCHYSPEVVVLPSPDDSIAFKQYIGCWSSWDRFGELLRCDIT